MQKRIIEVHQHDWMPGWAALDADSLKRGPAHVALNVGALIAAVEVGDLAPADVPYVVAESIMHEVVHVLEGWAGVEFDEDRVEALLERYRQARREDAACTAIRNDRGSPCSQTSNS